MRRTAYHEAGHAVVKYILHGRCGDLSISADGSGFCGGCGVPFRSPSDAVKVCLAGYAAEMMSAGEDLAMEILILSIPMVKDFSEALEIIKNDPVTKFFAGEGQVFILNWMSVQVELKQWWAGVEALAERLLVAMQVSDSEAKYILASSEAKAGGR